MEDYNEFRFFFQERIQIKAQLDCLQIYITKNLDESIIRFVENHH